MARILLIRFSALGDVAMTIPIIHSLASQYPQHEFTVLSRSALQPLFEQMPGNVVFHGVELNNEYKGIGGLNRLYSDLATKQFDYVADLHDVLRTKYLRFRFRLAGTKVASIDKGRSGKKALVREKNKIFQPQKSSFQRYADVLSKLGLPVQADFTSIYTDKTDTSSIESIVGIKASDEKWIGIAPFAKHDGKIYPIELQEQVVRSEERRVGKEC